MSSRPLLIPQKRALLPPGTGSSRRPVQKVLNPSAVPAETHMRQPTKDANASGIEEGDEPEKKYKCTGFAFATTPQPFLDPPTWEAMLKRKEQASRKGESDQSESETADQRRRRLEREAEYGSISIRGRSSVPRGARGRGRTY